MEDNILGCFVSSPIGDNKGPVFREYIWGQNGIAENLKKLKYYNYGTQLKLILFQFYVNPEEYLIKNLKEIEDFRKKEKAIGIPIIINEKNFFSKSDLQKLEFLKTSILQKLNLLDTIIGKHKLDTHIELLKKDAFEILSNLSN